MTGKSAVNFDDIMFTSIDSEDFLVNEEKPSLTSSWSSESEKDCHWKSSNSSLSQLQSPPKQSDIAACSTPLKCKSSDNTTFLTCREITLDNNGRSISGVNLSEILEKTPNKMNNFIPSPHPRSKRSLSLHDLDNVFEFPSNKLAKNAVSCEMSHSLASSKTRSKDSGIHRTASCVSLLSNNTYNRKYDHVQSKVKQYIQNMKELGNKSQSKDGTKPCIMNNYSRISSEPGDLTEEKFIELKNEILEKDLLISTYHEKYMDLQIKYANLKRKFDALRFGSTFHDESFSPDQPYYSAEEPFKLDLSNLGLGNHTYQSCDSSDPVSPVNVKSLKPITKSHSTSANLSCQLVPLNSVQTKSSRQPVPATGENSMKLCPDSKFGCLESSETEEVDSFLKVKRWQESLSSTKTKDVGNGRNSDVEGVTHDSLQSGALESDVQIFNSLPFDLPGRATSSCQQNNCQSVGNKSRSQIFKESIPEFSSYKFVKSVDQEHLKVHHRIGSKTYKTGKFTEVTDKLNLSTSSKEKDESFNTKPFLKSVSLKHSSDEPDLSWKSLATIYAEKTCRNEDEKMKLKKTKPRRKIKKSKQGGEVPDVLLNLTKENPTSIDDLRDNTSERIQPISSRNMFKPAFNSSNLLRSIPKPDMLPFASSTMENDLNIRKFYASKNLISPKCKEDAITQKSSHELVPTVFSSPISGSSVANISNDKSNKSALCCCLEASDLYINQLNEGLDKLMIALTELGTSTVFKS